MQQILQMIGTVLLLHCCLVVKEFMFVYSEPNC